MYSPNRYFNKYFKERLAFALFIAFLLLCFGIGEYFVKGDDSILAQSFADFKKQQQKPEDKQKSKPQPVQVNNPFLDGNK